MPYAIIRRDRKWVVVREGSPNTSRKTLGTHATEESAKRQLAAIRAAAGEKKR